ncbi:MAG: hypothetical protein EON48_13650 [Acetobacteraceae bacterium]|nr:MAG: hypothetical protein EON48_13650 [Acetobacteraceae bacterium]
MTIEAGWKPSRRLFARVAGWNIPQSARFKKKRAADVPQIRNGDPAWTGTRILGIVTSMDVSPAKRTTIAAVLPAEAVFRRATMTRIALSAAVLMNLSGTALDAS